MPLLSMPAGTESSCSQSSASSSVPVPGWSWVVLVRAACRKPRAFCWGAARSRLTLRAQQGSVALTHSSAQSSRFPPPFTPASPRPSVGPNSCTWGVGPVDIPACFPHSVGHSMSCSASSPNPPVFYFFNISCSYPSSSLILPVFLRIYPFTLVLVGF